jgi:hypothetical protein
MVMNPQDSATYQAVLRKGREQGLFEARKERLIGGRIFGSQQILVRVGTKRFGKPNDAILAEIEAIRDLYRLEDLADRILDPDVHD